MLEGGGAFLLVVEAAGLVGEVTLAFDVGVLEVVGPGADLAGAGFPLAVSGIALGRTYGRT